MGYGHVNDPSSLQEVAVRYFESLNDIWNNRSFQIAETLIVGLYPSTLASQGLVDATKEWLDANPGTPALRRLVIENLAGVERALRVQAQDKG